MAKYHKDFPDILRKKYKYISIPEPENAHSKHCKVRLRDKSWFAAIPEKTLLSTPILNRKCSYFSSTDLIQYCSELLGEPFDSEKHIINLCCEEDFDNSPCVIIRIYNKEGMLNPNYEKELEEYKKFEKEYEEETKNIHKLRRAWGKWKKIFQAESEEKEYKEIKKRIEVLEKKRNK